MCKKMNIPFIKLQKEFSPVTAARLINVETTFITKGVVKEATKHLKCNKPSLSEATVLMIQKLKLSLFDT